MSYNYSLSFTAFTAEDNETCLTAIREAESDIGSFMEIVDNQIVFDCDESYQKWCSAEKAVIPVIMQHIGPGTTCRIDWEGEDGTNGGELIGRGRKFSIIYEPYAVTDNGNIPLHEAEVMLAGCPDCPFGDKAKQACADGTGPKCAPKNIKTTWSYHDHGENVFFRKVDWQNEVANDNICIGYQEWVEHKLEELLYETDLDGVDAIEVAGCIELDRNVSVINEERAEFFSVYTRVTNEGVECICDFNTKGQALEFAKVLANRSKVPVCGNQCSIE